MSAATAYGLSYADLGRTYWAKGLIQKAIAAFQKAVHLSRRDSQYLALLAHAYARAGSRQKALALLRELTPRSRQ